MSAWMTFGLSTKAAPPPVYRGRDPRPYANTAGHIRGRVYRMHKNSVGHWMWGMEVINTHTGEVIASDNCSVREAIVDLADEATAAARAAWFWSFSKKKVN